MRKGNWKRLIASTSIIAMVTANMSSDLSAMRFVYADDATENSGEVSEAPAEPEAETPVVTESEPEEAPAEVAPTEEAPV